MEIEGMQSQITSDRFHQHHVLEGSRREVPRLESFGCVLVFSVSLKVSKDLFRPRAVNST